MWRLEKQRTLDEEKRDTDRLRMSAKFRVEFSDKEIFSKGLRERGLGLSPFTNAVHEGGGTLNGNNE